MLKSLKNLKKNGIETKNGDARPIKDFLSDDVRLKVQYIKVDTDGWLPGRTIMISTQTAGKPTGDNQLPVNLTTDQIRDSPIHERDKPIDRQYEKDLSGHYGWQPYWNDEGKTQNLISMNEVMKYHINALDGEIGHAEDLIIDDADWSIRYLVVDTSNWNPNAKRTLIPTNWINTLDITAKKIDMNVNKDKVKDSPEYNLQDMLSREDAAKTHGFHNKEGYQPGAHVKPQPM
jgi:hypothetical protein